MINGLIFGCWDLLHVGHIEALKEARAACDHLYVGCAGDNVIEQDKGAPPVIGGDHRIQMLQAIKYVNKVVPYYSLDFLPVVEVARPRIVFYCSDTWGSAKRHKDLEKWCKDNKRCFHPLGYHPLESTTSIKVRIKEDV